jgi:hypothetical protein
MKPMKHLIACALPALITASLQAGGTDGGTPPIVQETASGIRQETKFSTTFSPGADWEEHSDKGEVEIIQYDLSHLLTIPLTDQTNLITGVFASYTDIDITGPAALPDSLMNVGITLGATKDLTEMFGTGWSAKAILRPGFASDSSSISGSDFNLQGFVVFGYEHSPNLKWELGVGGSMEGDNPVLPVIGVEWRFAPDWTLTVGIPETGIGYQVTPGLKLRASGRFAGGTYHVDSQPASGSDDTWLQYSEIRVGLGADYEFMEGMMLSIDGGAVLERSFDYFDENYEIEGDTAAFLTLGIRARF